MSSVAFEKQTGLLRHPRKGFTLIELLVVIAIVSLLISLITPSLTMARERARGVACASQLRQVGIQMLLYAGEHGGAINSTSNSSPTNRSYWWNNQLVSGGYVDPSALHTLRCPFEGPFGGEAGGNWAWFTYGARAAEQNLEIRLSVMPDPSRYWMIGDSVRASGWQTFRLIQASMYQTGLNYNSITLGSVHLRHSDSANMFFGDGHVESLNQSDLKDLGFRGARDADLNILSF